jgi:16S rRNA (cytidine1402-2'-O)-methyltransferase
MADEGREAPAPYHIRGNALTAPSLAPGLYVVATPIGNLGDVTIRALDTLAAADLIACEDTRVTPKLLDRYGIRRPLASYHEHSGPAAHERILERLRAGAAVALVSDAGTPLVSDPGAMLVRNAIDAGVPVVPIPGPSAPFAALSASGVSAEAVLFLGFAPSKEGARRTFLEKVAPVDATLVFFESPNRIGAFLADAAAILGGERSGAVCREITKLHETFARGTLAALAAQFADAPTKGEIVVVVGPPPPREAASEGEIDGALVAALETKGVGAAAQEVAKAFGLSRRDLYQRALVLKGAKR